MCCGSDSYVSPVFKFLMFFFNFIFWVDGISLIIIGAWAFAEKNKLDDGQQKNYHEIFDLVFDLTILLVVLGVVIFILAFAGCLGALRENICLLKFFSYVLGALFLAEVILALLAFFFSNEIKSKVEDVFKLEGLVRYRDDDDFRNLIDWTQKTFKCCGVGEKGYKDWKFNPYFNCTPENPSAERCNVPYSCCKRPNDVQAGYVNTMCGFRMQLLEGSIAENNIHISGCLHEMIGLAKQNLFIIGGVVIGVAVLQILGIFIARALANQVEEQKDRWM